ncbi:MAG TPA: PepSY domain-containing protein [Acidobacteriaceae bacterium]
MSRPLPSAFLAIAFSTSMIAAATAYAESHVPCNTLPAAVLQHAKLETGDATVRGCVKDRENGKLTYEVETLKDGKSKDITLDVSGTVLEVEQEVAVSSLPPAVSDAIAKAAHRGKIGKVESVTRNGAIASYETTITSNGERREVAFSPQGAPVKAD